MKPVEDLLRESAASGKLNHLSISWTERGWEVAYRGVATTDHRLFLHDDVVCALRGAMTGKAGDPPPKKSRKRRPVVAQPLQEDEDILV